MSNDLEGPVTPFDGMKRSTAWRVFRKHMDEQRKQALDQLTTIDLVKEPARATLMQARLMIHDEIFGTEGEPAQWELDAMKELES